jgi:hypothetical protein
MATNLKYASSTTGLSAPVKSCMPLFAPNDKVNQKFGQEFSEIFYENYQDFAIVDCNSTGDFLDTDFFGLGVTAISRRLSKLIICGSID